jgi:hypothetical protein
VHIAHTPTVIERDQVSRRVDIGVDVGGRDPSAVAADIRERLATVAFPMEYRAQVIDQYGRRRICTDGWPGPPGRRTDHLPAVPGRLPELAAGDAGLPVASVRAGGRRGGGLPRR